MFPDSSVGKESACNMGDESSIPGSGRSPGGGNSNPSYRQRSLGAAVHVVTESDTTEHGTTWP